MDNTWLEGMTGMGVEGGRNQSFTDWITGQNVPERHRQDLFSEPEGETPWYREPSSEAASRTFQALTSNYGDNLLRAVGMPETAQRIDDEARNFGEEHPNWATASDVLGTGFSMGAGGAALAKMAPRLTAPATGLGLRALQGAGISGGQQALWSMGDEEKSWDDVARDTVGAATTGAAIPVAGAAARKYLAQPVMDQIARVKARRGLDRAGRLDPAEVVSTFKTAAREKYDEIAASGTRIKPRVVKGLKEAMEAVNVDEDNPHIYDKAIGIKKLIRKKLKKSKGDFEELHELSRSMNAEVRRLPKDSADYKAVMDMKGVLVDFFENGIDESALASGSADAGKMLREADKMWAKSAQMEVMEALFDDVEMKGQNFTQSGAANAIKREAQKLHKRINKTGLGRTAIRGWSKEQKELVKALATDDTGSEFFKWYARMAPRGPVGLATTIGSAAGGGVLGPIAGVNAPAAAVGAGTFFGGSMLAAREKDRRARDAVDNLVRMMANKPMVRPVIKEIGPSGIAGRSAQHGIIERLKEGYLNDGE